ncbi:MAG: signal peptidase I [Eubacterium sp.]|nr:signal peptidase I [Eubacterium sp.]
MGNKANREIDNAYDKEAEAESKQRVANEIGAYIRIIIIAIVIAVVLFKLILINAYVPSGSMERTIDAETSVLGFRLSYLFDEPERGDIIVFKYPVDEELKYIKRIIGLPGETVEISDGKIYINGSETPLEEDYISEEWTNNNDGFYYEVPEDSYFVLGDNRNESLDSRYWASEALSLNVAQTQEEAYSYSFVKEDQIVAEGILTYWPKFSIIKGADY